MNHVQSNIKAAIYTRKSHEEGLQQEFNSLHAQREAAEAFITAHKHEGWRLVPTCYDDGGYSGGSLERPALQQLLHDIQQGLIDIIVVYKIDRLTRSLVDFAKMIEIFEQYNVSFVSVTQQFNTTTSMGRLMLNVLLSFAQFEREVTGERIRDKFAASKRKGLWMGGVPPLGYDVVNRQLVVNEAEAIVVQQIYQQFVQTQSVTQVIEYLQQKGHTSKQWTTTKGVMRHGKALDKGAVYKILSNKVYTGQIHHHGQYYAGQHTPIIDDNLWQQAQQLKQAPPARTNIDAVKSCTLLRGILKCSGCYSGMQMTQTKRRDKIYRYYSPEAVLKKRCGHCPVRHVPMGEVDALVLQQVHSLLQNHAPDIAQSWPLLFLQQQYKIIHTIIAQILLTDTGMTMQLHDNAWQKLAQMSDA